MSTDPCYENVLKIFMGFNLGSVYIHSSPSYSAYRHQSDIGRIINSKFKRILNHLDLSMSDCMGYYNLCTTVLVTDPAS